MGVRKKERKREKARKKGRPDGREECKECPGGDAGVTGEGKGTEQKEGAGSLNERTVHPKDNGALRTGNGKSGRKRGRKKRSAEAEGRYADKEKRKKSRLDWMIAALSVLLVLFAGGMAVASKIVSDRRQEAVEAVWLAEEGRRRAKEDAEAEAERAAREERDRVYDFGMESGRNVFEAIQGRPPFVELTEENAEDLVTIESCRIDTQLGKIMIQAVSEEIPASDDKFYYLFSMGPYAKKLPEDGIPMRGQRKAGQVVFHIPRYFAGTESSVLHKFVVAVKKDGEYVPVSAPHYVTNQEAYAKYRSGRDAGISKKGLLVDPNKLRTSELDDLGVKQAAYNIPVSRILGHSTDGIHDTVYYKYNGKTYAFNGQVMSEYDLVFGILTAKGIEVTAIILNDASYSYPELLHPLSRGGIGSAPYYAFNASDEEGCEYLAAIGSFLAERYSGKSSGRGLVSNWVIGNEINARKEWNYMEYVSLESYVEEYARAFRMFYNAIKSVNSSARVYISLDQQWDRNISGNRDYDTKDILDEFNRQIKREGNIDWGLALHPYNVPLTTPYTWNASKYVKNSPDTSMVTMANIDVVTDYLEREEFLTEEGEVRSVSLSELGYTSSLGENVQAAAIVYAYKKAEANEHIDAILFSRQTDAVEEIAQGLALGLNHADGSHKYAYSVYKYMDTAQSEDYINFAKSMIGISDWLH